MAGQPLPSNFFEKMNQYLAAYRKKFAQARKKGDVDEHSTDPIPLPVYRLLLRRSIETNNVFTWTWTLLQWNCMARSASIDCLAFHNFSVGLDSLVIKYDDSKADKTGEKLSEKNVYANPLDWTMCSWLAIGIYCFLNQGNLVEDERLFLKKGTRDGAGSVKYHEQVVGLVRGMENSISPHMKYEKVNPYGLRKGAATHAVSGTTAAPSIPSIARRGEWSIGSVLDVYWHFGSVGDHYLGRILCGLDPNDTSFAVLPPHWNLEDPLGNPYIAKAMTMTYGTIMEAYAGQRKENPSGVLLRCLACIVYHSDQLRRTWVKFPGHDFCKLTLLQDSLLLANLKQLVTVEPTKGVILAPTGIPPHIGLAVQISEVLDTLGELVCKFGEHGDNLMAAVEDALEGKAWENGQVTGSKLREILETYRTDSIEAVDRQLQSMRQEVRQAILRSRDGHGADDNDIGGGGFDDCFNDGAEEDGRPRVNIFSYDGRFFAVPQGYQFPKANLLEGLRCWLNDQVVSEDGLEKVKAYRLMTAKMLPDLLSRQFRTNWLPIFKYLDPILKTLPRNVHVTDEEIVSIHGKCMVFLKERVAYLWKDRSNPKEYSVGTWSNRISYASIMKYGTAADKQLLKEPSNRNKAGNGVRRKRQIKSNVKHPSRQDRMVNKAAAAGGGTDSVAVAAAGGGGGSAGGVTAGGASNVARVVAAAGGGSGTTAGGSNVATGGRGSNVATGGRGSGRGGGRGSGRGGGRAGRGRAAAGGADGGELFTAAFAEVDGELPEALRQRHEQIVTEDAIVEAAARLQDEERQFREEGWASRPIPRLRNYGDVSGFDRQRMGKRLAEEVPLVEDAANPMMRQKNTNGRSIGCCCITGCINSGMELIHRCHGRCKEFIHMICAEPFNNLSEDERYCNRCISKK